MTITNGSVEYERNVRPADFESKKAKVVLSFVIEEGSDPAPVVAKVMDMAVAEVHRRLALTTDYPQVDVAKVAEAVATKKRAKAPPAEVPVENPTDAAISAGSTKPSAVPVPATTSIDPAAIGEPEPIDLAKVGTVIPPIADKDLHAAVQIAIEKKVLAAAIRAATQAITGNPGQSMTTIGQDRRPEFLTAIRQLYD